MHVALVGNRSTVLENPRSCRAKFIRSAPIAFREIRLAGSGREAWEMHSDDRPGPTAHNRDAHREARVHPDFANGYPTDATIDKLYDERDFQRLPGLSLVAAGGRVHVMATRHHATVGARNGQVVAILSYGGVPFARKDTIARSVYYRGSRRRPMIRGISPIESKNRRSIRHDDRFALRRARVCQGFSLTNWERPRELFPN
jgi:hypothetical protein